jgi:hypothetical protein
LVVFGFYEFSADVSKAAHWDDFQFWVLCDKGFIGTKPITLQMTAK